MKMKISSHIVVLFIFVLCISAFLRFYNIKNRGFYYNDEASFLFSTTFYVDAVHKHTFLLEQLSKEKIDLTKIESTMKGAPRLEKRFGHQMLVFLFALLTGGVRDYTGFLYSAIFGMIAIVLVYYIGYEMYSKRAGIFASMILAISSYHVMYSRSGLSEMTAPVFFLLGIWMYYRSYQRKSTKYLIYSGLFISYFFISHYRWFYLVAVFYLCEMILYLNHDAFEKREFVKRIILLSLTISVFPALYELCFILFEQLKEIPPHMDYFNQMFDFTKRQSAKGPMIYPHILMIKYIWVLEGPIISLLLSIAVIYTFKKRTVKDILIATVVVMPILLFSLKSRGDRPVALSLIIPIIALVVGSFIDEMITIFSKQKTPLKVRFVTFLIFGVIFTFGFINSYKLLNYNSGYKEAWLWLKEHNIEKHLTTANCLLWYTGGRDRYLYMPKSYQEAKELYNSGYKYLLVDWKINDSRIGSLLIDSIENKLTPVKTIDNTFTKNYVYCTESFHYRHFDHSFNERVINNKKSHTIRIYDLSEYFETLNKLKI